MKTDPHIDQLFPASLAHDTGCRRLIRLPPGWRTTAKFDGLNSEYRYTLTHTWDDSLPKVMFAMMNPSGADITMGDSTVMRTAGIANRLGYGGQIIVNACAYRAVRPTDLLTVSDPVGPRNLATIAPLAEKVSMVVIAHGQLPPNLQHHAEAMVRTLSRAGRVLFVLGLAGDGTPLHPLARGKMALPAKVVPQVWLPSYR